MGMASKFLGSQKSQKISEAFDSVQTLLNNSSSPQEAFKKANLSPEMLQQIKGYLNNPMAGMILKPLGLDVMETRAMLDQLQSGGVVGNPPVGTPVGGVPQSQTQVEVGELQSLQADLARLKK